jgi:hypothetical protein
MNHPSSPPSRRIAREKRTVAAMVGIYCRAHHDSHVALCSSCGRLIEYAFCRLDHCPFGVKKTPCARCHVHCFGSTMRDRMKEVMRYAGLRMAYRHPIMALLHQWDKLHTKKRIA